MAKRQRSIFESDTPFEEIQTAAKQVQKNTLEQIPSKEDKKKPVARKAKKTLPKKVQPTVNAKTKTKPEKPMYLYVDVEHHRKAKINAVTKGMKLGEYIEWLIDQDTN